MNRTAPTPGGPAGDTAVGEYGGHTQSPRPVRPRIIKHRPGTQAVWAACGVPQGLGYHMAKLQPAEWNTRNPRNGTRATRGMEHAQPTECNALNPRNATREFSHFGVMARRAMNRTAPTPGGPAGDTVVGEYGDPTRSPQPDRPRIIKHRPGDPGRVGRLRRPPGPGLSCCRPVGPASNVSDWNP
jgi:hypothetical protein